MKPRFLVVKKRSLIMAVCILLVIVTLSLCCAGSGAYAVFFNKPIRRVPIYRVDTEKKQVALTFDAAWGADKTEEIIKILGENNARGTFFLVGFWIDKYPEMVKKIDEAGLEIGTHSSTHPKMSTLSAGQQRNELESCCKKLTGLTGKKVNVFRPPFGDYNNSLIEVAESLDLKTIQWGTDSLDWKGLSTEQLVNRVMPRVKPGDIILFHNNSDHVADALPIIARRLVMQGYELVTVSELVYQDNYFIDTNGIQHKQS